MVRASPIPSSPLAHRLADALAELLGDIACATTMDALAVTIAAGLVDVFGASSSAVYFAAEDERTLLLLAAQNLSAPIRTIGIDGSLPIARAARSRSTLFVIAQPPSALGRTRDGDSAEAPALAFAAAIVLGPRLLGALSAGFAVPPTPDRCAALGTLRDAIAARAGDVSTRPSGVLPISRHER